MTMWCGLGSVSGYSGIAGNGSSGPGMKRGRFEDDEVVGWSESESRSGLGSGAYPAHLSSSSIQDGQCS